MSLKYEPSSEPLHIYQNHNLTCKPFLRTRDQVHKDWVLSVALLRGKTSDGFGGATRAVPGSADSDLRVHVLPP
jgi:hypothetical protein